MKKKLLVVFLIILFHSTLNAQIPEPPGNVPSPQAWNFMQYGKMPISHFTGLPNVGIVLDVLQESGVSIPISLNYNVSNVRPDIHPGPTGRGWNLSLGGVISRKVNDLVDEFDYTIYNNYAGLGWDTIPFFNGYRNSSHSSLQEITVESILGTTRPLICQGSPGNCNYNSPAEILRPIPHVVPYLWDNVTYMDPCTNVNCTFFWLNSYGGNGWTDWHSQGHKDRIADEFSFNVMGLSGKFFLPRGNATEVTDIVCNKKVKIRVSSVFQNIPLPSALEVPTYNGPGGTSQNMYFNMSPWQRYYDTYPKTIWFFTIEDDEGNTFYFGKTASDLNYNGYPEYAETDAIDYGIGIYNISQDYWTADSWYLTRLETATGKSINYEYTRGDFQTNMYLSSFDSNVTDSSASAAFNRFGRDGRLIYPSRLTRIHSESFDIRLQYSNSTQLRYERGNYSFYVSRPGLSGTLHNTVLDYSSVSNLKWPQLDCIKVKKFGRDTVFYNFSYTADTVKRLYLTQVASSNNIANNEVYRFSYNTDSLPNYLSGQTDHWGFWNGRTPSSNNPYVYYADKQPDTTYLYSGTLKQIQYPTGGITQLFFEPNEYSKVVSPVRTNNPDSITNTFGGGLRIKKTMDYDSVRGAYFNVKEYIYKRGYTNNLNASQIQALSSSGVLNMKPQYRWLGKSTYYNPVAIVTDSILFNVQSTQPLHYTTDDYHIGYSEVIEKSNDKSYTIYKFTNHDNGFKDEPFVTSINNVFNSPFTKYTSKSFERGLTLEKSEYDSSNTIVIKKLVTYTVSDTSRPYINSCEAGYFNNGAHHGGNSYISYNRWVLYGTQFKTYKHITVPSVEETFIYQNGQNPLVTKTKYYYNNSMHGGVRREETVNSKGDTISTVYKYGADYAGDFMFNTINKLKPKTVLEKIIMKKSPGGSQQIISGQIYEFGLNSFNSGKMPWLNSVYVLEISAPFDSMNYTSTVHVTRSFNGSTYSKDSRYKEVAKMHRYDVNSNVLEATNQKGERTIVVRDGKNNLVTAVFTPTSSETAYYLWGYTSFESNISRNIEGIPSSEYDGSRDFLYSGSPVDTTSFSGRRSFVGSVQTKDYVHAADIIVVARKGGNPPLHQYLSGSTIYTDNPFVKIGERGGWEIYKTNHIHGGTKIIVNSNGNKIDEVRILPSGSNGFMMTYCYNEGLLSTVTDKNFNRSFYEYDVYHRLKTVRDDDGRIIKHVDYKFQQNYLQ